MELPFLSKVYLPPGVSTPQYEELYKTILTYQAKDDKTARFFLASPTDVDDTSIFIARAIEDPMEESPFDIDIRSIKHHASLSLPSDKVPSAAVAGAAPDSPGISASMVLKDDHCGIQSASGVFKVKRVWTTKVTSSGTFAELFAGYLTFDVSYSGMYKRKGHGTGQKHKWGFWAIRARTGDDGMEIGLRSRLPVAVRANAEIPPTHPVAATASAAVPGTANQVRYIMLMLVSSLPLTIQPQAASQGSTAPKFAGNFNLYAMCGLIEEGHVPDEPFALPEDVYNAITNADPEVTARCRLGSSLDISGSDLGSDDSGHDEADSEGRFLGTSICDPFAEQPYDVIITSTEEEESLSFTEDELDNFPAKYPVSDLDPPPSGPGMTAQITLSERDHPGVIAGSGYIKFVRVWMKASANGELLEVFEAYLNLDLRFEMNFKLHGQRFRPQHLEETHAVAFWAVRAGKDEGEDWFPRESSESYLC